MDGWRFLKLYTRRRWQFSLRVLLFALLVIATIVGGGSWWLQHVRAEWVHEQSTIKDLQDAKATVTTTRIKPKWATHVFAERQLRYFDRVTSVSITVQSASRLTEDLKGLKYLKQIGLCDDSFAFVRSWPDPDEVSDALTNGHKQEARLKVELPNTRVTFRAF